MLEADSGFVSLADVLRRAPSKSNVVAAASAGVHGPLVERVAEPPPAGVRPPVYTVSALPAAAAAANTGAAVVTGGAVVTGTSSGELSACGEPPEPSRGSTAAAVAGSAVSESPVVAAAIREARLFRAALSEALEAVVVELSRRLAVDVVGRELRLAPVDLATLARRLIDERMLEHPVRLRVAFADAEIACELPLIVDPALQAGDAVLECRGGAIDARLTVRLAAALAAVRA